MPGTDPSAGVATQGAHVTSRISRLQVRRYRAHAQQLGRSTGHLDDTAVLDIGVQDTGSDGASWALALRGLAVAAVGEEALATVWTVRGAPHVYRRTDLPQIAAAVAPRSDAEAGKRIYDASKPLKSAGIPVLDALDAIADRMRAIVDQPTGKGEVSSRLAAAMSEPYLRWCRPCQATHLYEMPFRLAAIRAGLELRAGTSPPVLQRIPGFRPAKSVSERFDLTRCYLRLLGPASPRMVAAYLDSPVKDVTETWPDDAVEVIVDGDRRSILADDLDALADPPASADAALLGPFDLFLQLKDRPTAVDDDAGHAKEMWPALGRPGGVLHKAELVGSWRPRKTGRRFGIEVNCWRPPSATLTRAIGDQAERLAAHRGAELSRVAYA